MCNLTIPGSASLVRLGFVSLIPIAVLLASCGGDGQKSASLPGYVQSELAHASAFQREILKDGVVTPAEYEKSVLGTLQCLDQNGIPHSEPQLEERGGRLRWHYTYGPFPQADQERVEKAFTECDNEYERAVVAVWVQQTAPSEKDNQEMIGSVLACLKDHGMEVASADEIPDISDSWTQAESAVYQNCLLLVYRGEDRFPK